MRAGAHRLLRALLQGACLTLLPGLAAGAEGPIAWETETLTGDWGGTRSDWSEKGINTELLFKGTLMANPVGGIKRGSDYMQNLEMKVALDTAKLWNVPDSSAYVHFLLNSGGKMNAAYVGSLMGVDNSEVRENNPKLFQAWFNKNFMDSTVSFLAGVYPVDTEFYVTDASAIFLHPSYGMSAEIAQTGRNGPSIYPLASMGVRLKFQPVPTLYAQAALVDGHPGEGRHPHWTRINPFHGDGSFFMAEIGYRPGKAQPREPEGEAIAGTAPKLEERYEPVAKYAVGYWSYSKRFDDLLDTDAQGAPIQRANQGAYFLLEKSVYRTEDAERDVAVFLRHGRAEKDVNIFDRSTGIGVRARGLIPGRVDDIFGVAATRSHAGEKYRLAQEAAGTAIRRNEAVVEVSYRAQVRPWLAIQPDLQRIINPGLQPDIRNATVVGLRCEISF